MHWDEHWLDHSLDYSREHYESFLIVIRNKGLGSVQAFIKVEGWSCEGFKI